jgi:hypothetical protein
MNKSFGVWVGWFIFLLIVDFLVPFQMLKNVPRVGGSFLFWIIWVVVAIISMFFIFLRWREDDSQD